MDLNSATPVTSKLSSLSYERTRCPQMRIVVFLTSQKAKKEKKSLLSFGLIKNKTKINYRPCQGQ